MSLLRKLEQESQNSDDDDDDTLTTILVIIAAVMVVLALICCCYVMEMRRRSQAKAAVEVPLDVEEPVKEEPEDVEQTDSGDSSAADEGPTVMTTCDVHNCTSGSCDLCRKDVGPKFVCVTKETIGTGLRVKGLPYRWWEKNFDEKAVKERFDKECDDKERVYTDESQGPLYHM